MTREEALAYITSQPEGEHFTVLAKSAQVQQRRINGERNRRFIIQCLDSQAVALNESWETLLTMCDGQKTRATDALILLINEYVAEELAR